MVKASVAKCKISYGIAKPFLFNKASFITVIVFDLMVFEFKAVNILTL